MGKFADLFGVLGSTFTIGSRSLSAGVRRLAFRSGAFLGTIDWTLTANRTIVLPNRSGTIALVEDVYQRIADSSSNVTFVYFGKASPGAAQSDSVWQVGRVTQGSNPIKTYAASGAFTVAWADRLTLTYS